MYRQHSWTYYKSNQAYQQHGKTYLKNAHKKTNNILTGNILNLNNRQTMGKNNM